MKLEEIEKYVRENGLDKKTRKPEIAEQRFFICNYIRDNYPSKTLQYIADVVNLVSHDRVIYAIKRHAELMQYDKKTYLNRNKPFISFVEYGEDVTKLDIREELLKANGLIEFHRLQEQVKKGLI